MRYTLFTAAVLAAMSLASADAAVVLDTGGFEAYAPGTINGQNGWANAPTWGQPFKDAVIADAPGGGKAILFDNTGGATAPHEESSIQVTFPNLTGSEQYVTATFDFYRDGNGLYNNLWWWPVGANPWSGLQWDNAANPDAKILPFGFGAPTTLMPQSQWVNMKLEFDLVNGTETAWVNGVLVGENINIGTGAFEGWFFSDTNTVDPGRTPNGVGQRAWVDNLLIVTGRGSAIPEPATLSLLGLGLLPMLRRRRTA